MLLGGLRRVLGQGSSQQHVGPDAQRPPTNNRAELTAVIVAVKQAISQSHFNIKKIL